MSNNAYTAQAYLERGIAPLELEPTSCVGLHLTWQNKPDKDQSPGEFGLKWTLPFDGRDDQEQQERVDAIHRALTTRHSQLSTVPQMRLSGDGRYAEYGFTATNTDPTLKVAANAQYPSAEYAALTTENLRPVRSAAELLGRCSLMVSRVDIHFGRLTVQDPRLDSPRIEIFGGYANREQQEKTMAVLQAAEAEFLDPGPYVLSTTKLSIGKFTTYFSIYLP